MAKKQLTEDRVGRVFEKSRACVEVRREKNTLVVKGGSGIQFSAPSTPFGALADGIRVVDENGKELPASGAYYITLETIDPYHLLTDVFNQALAKG